LSKLLLIIALIEEMSKWALGLKEWLRWVRDNRPALWKRIVEYNKRKRNKIAEKIRKVRDEWY